MHDALIVTIDVVIDETMKTRDHHSHNVAALSDAEVLTVAVVAAHGFGKSPAAGPGPALPLELSHNADLALALQPAPACTGGVAAPRRRRRSAQAWCRRTQRSMTS